MKQALLIALTISVSSTTWIEVPENMIVAVFPKTCKEDYSVDCGTATVPVPVVSTGPFTLKSTSGDCYRIDYMNANGTMSKSPATWVKCP